MTAKRPKSGSTSTAKKIKSREIVQTEHGTTILRTAPYVPLVLSDEGRMAWRREERDGPFGLAKNRLYEILNSACVDPVIVLAPELARFVHLMREVAMESASWDSLEEILSPIETLYAAMRSNAGGGGRPPVEDTWQEWRRRVEHLRKLKPSLSAQERYEEVAADWEAEKHPPTKWRRVRDGISELKRRGK